MAQYKHLFLLRFPATADRSEIAGIFEALNELAERIPGVVDVSGGPYNSSEGLNKGFTHACVVTLQDEQARDAFVAHPLRQQIQQWILDQLAGGLADLIAFDFKDCNRSLY